MNPGKTNIADERVYRTRILGTGAADPTKEAGPGVTVTWVATGRYKYTFANNPGTFVGVEAPVFGAATPSAVKGYSISHDTYDTTDDVFSIELSLWDASNAAVDLAALQYLSASFVFSAQSGIT